MKKRTAAIALGSIALALVLSAYASPYWVLSRMRAAVEARDSAALARYVDFPRLRDSVKIGVMRRLGADGALAESRANPFAAFGRAMALAVIDPVVDAAVSPAGVAAMLAAGDIRVQPMNERREDPAAAPAPAADPPREKLNYDLSYRTWNQVVVERADGGGVRFVLDRSGVWSWKLVGVEQPED